MPERAEFVFESATEFLVDGKEVNVIDFAFSKAFGTAGMGLELLCRA